MEEKNWLEPTEVLEYNTELGEVCMNDPENDWTEKSTDGIGVTAEEVEE